MQYNQFPTRSRVEVDDHSEIAHDIMKSWGLFWKSLQVELFLDIDGLANVGFAYEQLNSIHRLSI